MRARAPKREALHSGLVTDESHAHLDTLRLLVGLSPLPRRRAVWQAGSGYAYCQR